MRKPKATKAPRKPFKPSKPNKMLKYNEMIYLKLYSTGNKMSIKEIIEQIPDGVDVEDVSLEVGYDDCYSCYGCCPSRGPVNAIYQKEVENQQYAAQLKAYEKKMVKYNDKMEDFKFKLGEWEIKNEEFLEELDLWTAEETEREINKLEHTLKKLKAS